MAIRRYTDPTIGFNRFSSLKYPSTSEVGINFSGAIKPTNKFFNPDRAKMMGKFSADNAGFMPTAPEAGTNIKNIANELMPYASNIVNSFRKLPKPIAPQLESPASFTPVSFDADRAAIENQGTAYGRETDYRVGNRTVAQALKAKMKAGQIAGMNDLAQKEGNTNALLKSRYDELNQGVQARNVGRLKQFNDEIVSRSLKEQELNAENLANMSDKYQMNQRDKALQSQEGRKLIIQSLGIDRSMLGPDSIKALDDFTAEEKKRLGYKKFGGRLKKLY